MPKTAKKEDEQEKITASNNLLSRVTLSETLILSIIPFTAYSITFFYQFGYFSFFNIPFEFISFDLTRVFLSLLSIVLLIAISFYFSELIVWIFDAYPEVIKRRLRRSTYPLIFSVVFMFFTTVDWKFNIPVLLFLLSDSVAPFLVPLISQRKVKGYIEKLQAEEIVSDNENQTATPGPIKKISLFIGKNMSLIAILFVLALFLSYQLGNGTARKQAKFRIVNTKPERMVLWIYDDHIILAPFNRQTKEFESIFFVINIGEDPNIEYKLEEIGPLKLKKITVVNTAVVSPTLTPIPTFTLTPTLTYTPKPTNTIIPKPTSTP